MDVKADVAVYVLQRRLPSASAKSSQFWTVSIPKLVSERQTQLSGHDFLQRSPQLMLLQRTWKLLVSGDLDELWFRDLHHRCQPIR